MMKTRAAIYFRSEQLVISNTPGDICAIYLAITVWMRRQEPFPDGMIFNLRGRRERIPALHKRPGSRVHGYKNCHIRNGFYGIRYGGFERRFW